MMSTPGLPFIFDHAPIPANGTHQSWTAG